MTSAHKKLLVRVGVVSACLVLFCAVLASMVARPGADAYLDIAPPLTTSSESGPRPIPPEAG